MATVNKDFKIKSGLIVEGTNATVNGNQILTENAGDQYILDLIGGETLVKSVSNQFNVSGAGELSLDLAVVDTYYDENGAADAAELNAKNYTDTGLGLKQDSLTVGDGLDLTGATLNVVAGEMVNKVVNGVSGNSYGIVGNATYLDVTNPTGYNSEIDVDITALESKLTTDGFASQTDISSAITALDLPNTYDAKGTAAALIDDASNLSTEVWSAYKTSTEIGLAQAAAELHADNAVADLVNGAPALLDTLNELAAALQDNPDVITDLQDIAAGKQDTLTAGSNIDITGATISVTGLDSADISDFNTAALSATSAAYDIAGAAATAQSNAEDYADGLAINYDAAGSASTAQSNAETFATNAINALDTDDIEEGVINEYFTDSRAKSSAADLLTGATLSNITITGTGAGLTITAENGVADSDTDDLVEGSTNLYFTDSRVTTAITNATHIAPQAIDITWVRREEATWTDVATASKVTCHSAGTSEGSMKYLVRVTASVGGTRHSHVTEVLATVDGGNNVAVVEYGTIYTSTNPMATVTVEWNASTSKYDLNVTTANANSEVMVAATLIASLD